MGSKKSSSWSTTLRLRRLRFRRLPLSLLLCLLVLYALDYLGLFMRLQEEALNENVHFSNLQKDLTSTVEDIVAGKTSLDQYMPARPNYYDDVGIKSKNRRVQMTKSAGRKCLSGGDSGLYIDGLRLAIVVKSALKHYDRRKAIRSTWGHEKRFSDVTVRTVFLVGKGELSEEDRETADIVQGDFVDHYSNNTLKTLLGLRWGAEICPKARFYLFVDDDYYVSLRNLLTFLRDPVHYPRDSTPLIHLDLPEDALLYAGHVFSESRPMRNKNSKWFISLEEYKYNQYPPYVSGGAFVVSKEALKRIFLASHFINPFVFDDIYTGILAREIGIEAFHSDHFHVDRRHAAAVSLFRDVIASHGFGDPEQMSRFWNRQKELGHA